MIALGVRTDGIVGLSELLQRWKQAKRGCPVTRIAPDIGPWRRQIWYCIERSFDNTRSTF